MSRRIGWTTFARLLSACPPKTGFICVTSQLLYAMFFPLFMLLPYCDECLSLALSPPAAQVSPHGRHGAQGYVHASVTNFGTLVNLDVFMQRGAHTAVVLSRIDCCCDISRTAAFQEQFCWSCDNDCMLQLFYVMCVSAVFFRDVRREH